MISVTSSSGAVTYYDNGDDPVLTRNGNELLIYDGAGKPFYTLSGQIDESVVSSFLSLHKISGDREYAEKVSAAKSLILEEAVAATAYALASYSDAKLKLDAATKARMAAESFSVSTSIGLIRAAGYYTWSQDGVTISKSGASFKYDKLGRIVAEDTGKGYIRSYEYSDNAINQIITERSGPVQASISYQPFMPGGHLALTGVVGKETLVKRYDYETLVSMPVYSVDFALDDKDPEVSFGIRQRDGDALLGKYRIEVVAHSSCLAIKGYKEGVQYVSVPVTDLKLNTQYSARFEVTGQGVNVYVWEKGLERPVVPSCILDAPQWSPRFFVSTSKGNAIFDNFSVSVKISPKQSISAIAKLWNANQAESIARVNAGTANSAYLSAQGAELKARAESDEAAEFLKALEAQENVAVSAQTELESNMGLARTQMAEGGGAEAVMRLAAGSFVDDIGVLRSKILGAIDFSYIVYDSDRLVREVGLFDGSRTLFDEKGLPVLSDADGLKTDYSYLVTSSGDIAKVVAKRVGSASVYGMDGSISSLTTYDGTEIEYTNGDISSIATPGGSSRIYIAGRLSAFFDKDGSSFTYGEDGKPLAAKDKDGNSYTYEYSIDPGDGQDMVLIRDLSHGVSRLYKTTFLSDL